MTDKEKTLKALEVCLCIASIRSDCACFCPAFNHAKFRCGYKYGTRELYEEVVDLINRKEAEIERLQVTIKDLSEFLENETEKRERLEKELKSCNYNYERLNSDYRLLVTLRTKSINETRTETIKDFVERLCDKLSECHTVSDEHYECTGYDCEETITAIDNLAEEMLKELKEK